MRVDQICAARENSQWGSFLSTWGTGHIEQAQQMLDQVLRDHPDSAKAHFVQAEIDAAEGHYELARAQLALAEKLKPGLPNIKPRAVQELKAKLGLPSS
jgi:predicted Zn-dependent protease